MELLQKNPFTTIKANDLNDSEINEQWVDVQGTGFLDLFCPTNAIAQYILGGKGSGKTHLMRYFSYKSQLLRNKGSIELLVSDGYFGVYFQASGLNGSRFEHLPISPEAREAIFVYSFELWIAGLVLESVLNLMNENDSILNDEAGLCKDIAGLFIKDVGIVNSADTILKMKSGIVELSNSVDLEINNSFIKQTIDVEILTNRGALIFGIPELLAKHSDVFKDLTFLYLIDELENIGEDQQKYFNTLVREKKLPVTFRIGARRHGIKTWKTLGAGETNREGHEFELLRLDNVFTDNESYEEFATDLIINRLIGSKLLHRDLLPVDKTESTKKKRRDYLIDLFEFSKDKYSLYELSGRESTALSPVMNKFRAKLEKSALIGDPVPILNCLRCDRDLLVEKAAIHLFCQRWSKNKLDIDALMSLAKDIESDIQKLFLTEDKSNPLAEKISYYQNNYMASVLRSVKQNNLDQYHGFENLLILTKGFPRHILTVLRNMYRLEIFKGNHPFVPSSKVSKNSQKLALKESTEWFHDDSVSEGHLGGSVELALGKLCEILRIEMYSDKPVECSASGFTIDKNSLSVESKAILEWAEMIRVIIPAAMQRQDKNSQKMLDKYQINGLLCPRWGLSLSRRGAISFTVSDFEKIFNPKLESEFNDYKNKFYNSRNGPYNVLVDRDDEFDEQIGLGF